MGKVIAIGTELSNKAMTSDMKEVNGELDSYRALTKKLGDDFFGEHLEAMKEVSRTLKEFGPQSEEYLQASLVAAEYELGGSRKEAFTAKVKLALSSALGSYDDMAKRWGVK